jgi:hypothetical protein
MNIQDCRVPIEAFGDAIGGVELEALRLLAHLNSEWAALTKPAMTFHRVRHVQRGIAQHLAPFVNDDGTYNTPKKGPLKLDELDLDLEAVLRILDMCKVWRTRKPRSRRPEMSFLYTEACFKPLDKSDELRLARTTSFMLLLLEHPAIGENVVGKVCWMYVIYKYLDQTHAFSYSVGFSNAVVRQTVEVRDGIKRWRSRIPDHLKNNMFEVLSSVAKAYRR